MAGRRAPGVMLCWLGEEQDPSVEGQILTGVVLGGWQKLL